MRGQFTTLKFEPLYHDLIILYLFNSLDYMAYISLKKAGGGAFTKLTPYVMIYLTYSDLIVKLGEMA